MQEAIPDSVHACRPAQCSLLEPRPPPEPADEKPDEEADEEPDEETEAENKEAEDLNRRDFELRSRRKV